MKVVVDVNVWISALLWGGVPDKVLILAEDKKITIFASEALFIELETTLRRRKFQSKIQSLNLNVDDVINATKMSYRCVQIFLLMHLNYAIPKIIKF
ncbi:MAG: putative toxin-antitoxin system toxin component, PIN family [Brasilonema sp.]